MRGNYGKQKYLEMLVFLLLARESVKEERGHAAWKRNGTVPRSMEGWEEGFVVFMYTPVFSPLVGLVGWGLES